MFFKRIELVGFKSFATKTVLDFIPGTTVIVGPNGCGKSNVLDAIKWVLGEQAASQMRGKKMQDVIFAGSASFKALGVAQVTLTIDNTSRLLPVDYDEVQVTRRLFRNGESEYLINKTPSRLRDVHDLFLGTGIGKSAYSMLEQGRVSQIIEAKPQERRFLFEEAAGISKFKIRKLEALRKLERTDVDLSRLNDLLVEVERQVGTLKRQASKAERYKELHDTGRRAEQELTVIRSRELREKVGSLDGQLQGLRDRLAGLGTELAQRRAEEEVARDRELELNEAITDENQAIWDLKQNLTEAEHQIHRLNDQMGVHQRRIEQIQGEFAELDLQANELELRLQEAEQRHVQADAARGEHNAKYEELSLQYFALQETVQERTRCIDELGSEVNKLRQALTRAENEVRMAEGLIARHEQDREQGGSVLTQLEEQCIEAELQHEDLTRREAELANGLVTMQTELEQQRTLRRERQEGLAQRMRALQDAARQLHESGSRLSTLRELSNNYEGYYQGVREAMLAADRREIHGVLGIATNLIRAQKEHELAIEVALATHLQDIVVRTADDGKQAIEFLKRHGRGRATFLPLDRLRVEPLNYQLRQVLSRPGVLGVAGELVQYDRQIQTAVDYLLGTTIVVRDLDVALDLGRQGFRARYVSLDGQLINPGGAMTGGRIQATGLMTREREIRDLEARVNQLERDQQQGQAEIARLQDELSTAHNRAEQLQSELETKRLEHNSLRKDLEAAARAKVEAEKARQERGAQLERIDQEIAGQRATIERAGNDAALLTTQLHQAEEKLAAEKDSARTQSDDIYTLGVSLAEARTSMERERERAETAQREQGQIRHDLENLTRLRQTRLREIEQLREEDVLLTTQIDRIKQEMEGSSAEFERINRLLVNSQAERDELQGRLKELTATVERLERDERAVDNELREIEHRHIELQTHFDSLNEQCGEKFGKTLVELAEELGEIENQDPHALQTQVTEIRDRLERMGPVNMAALDEYKEQAARFEYLKSQHKDLTEAKEQLLATIQKLDETTRSLFQQTFETVRANFIEVFRRLFNGGRADLLLEAPEGTDPMLEGGIEFLAQPPGKQVGINSLSGGEKAMTAVALLFALFLHKPSPFCIMDEIDAPLDDANVERFKNMVGEFTHQTQFVVITHNKLTMELADAIYGVTMEEMGVSKLVSVRFQEAEALVDAV